ncbi:MAG: enoyl-CoA hydratase/isomerase family protein [Acidobacteriaceae bacterium]
MSEQQVPNGDDVVLCSVRSDGVATICLNRPQTRNAIDDELIDGLLAALQQIERDTSVRCAVLTSSHESVFSAGGNLKGFAEDLSAVDKHARNGRFPRILESMMALKVPLLCALNGHALAGGLGLVMACDLVLAKQGVRIGTPEINVGVFPLMISTLMQRNISRKQMSELIFLGDQMTAEEGMQIGIINRVIPAADFDATVSEWAGRLAVKSPLMLRLGKRALYETQDLPLQSALSLLQHYLTMAQGTDDVKEGVRAFLEKRDPVWHGR